MESESMDLAKLAGFDQLGQCGEIDFQGDALGARVGAKRADVEAGFPS